MQDGSPSRKALDLDVLTEKWRTVNSLYETRNASGFIWVNNLQWGYVNTWILRRLPNGRRFIAGRAFRQPSNDNLKAGLVTSTLPPLFFFDFYFSVQHFSTHSIAVFLLSSLGLSFSSVPEHNRSITTPVVQWPHQYFNDHTLVEVTLETLLW